MSEKTTRLTWRAAMWWLAGYSAAKSGEELANPEQLDEVYREDFERGYALGAGYECQE